MTHDIIDETKDLKIREIRSLDELLDLLNLGGLGNDPATTQSMVQGKVPASSGAAKALDFLVEAARTGNIAVLMCTENATGKIVPVLVATRPSGLGDASDVGIDMLPIGVLFDLKQDADPCSKYTPLGDGVETVETETGRRQREGVEDTRGEL